MSDEQEIEVLPSGWFGKHAALPISSPILETIKPVNGVDILSSNVPETAQKDPICDVEPRCFACSKFLAVKLTRPWEMKCVRCGCTNRGQT